MCGHALKGPPLIGGMSERDVATIFFALVLAAAGAVGLFFRHASRLYGASSSAAGFLLANRALGVGVGACSLVASYTSAGMLIGTSQVMASEGIVWAVGTLCWPLSLALGGLMVAPQLRAGNYLSVVDPLQERLGPASGAAFAVPLVVSMVIWASAILISISAGVSVLLDIDATFAVLVSASAALVYTLVGGITAVTATDVVQVVVVVIALALVIPVAATNPSVCPLFGGGSAGGDDCPPQPVFWRGLESSSDSVGGFSEWIDRAVLCLLGPLPQQVFAQRVLAARSASDARRMGLLAGAGHLLVGCACALLGAVGAQVRDWSVLADGDAALEACATQPALRAPCVIRYLTPFPVALAGLCAFMAAMLSSLDSATLAAAALMVLPTARLRCALRERCASRDDDDVLEDGGRRKSPASAWQRDASLLERPLDDPCIVLKARGAMMSVTAAATVAALWTPASAAALVLRMNEVSALFVTPPLLCTLHWRGTNAYGVYASVAAVLATAPLVSSRALTIALAFALVIAISLATNAAFFLGWLPAGWDLLHVARCTAVRAWVRERGWLRGDDLQASPEDCSSSADARIRRHHVRTSSLSFSARAATSSVSLETPGRFAADCVPATAAVASTVGSYPSHPILVSPPRVASTAADAATTQLVEHLRAHVQAADDALSR